MLPADIFSRCKQNDLKAFRLLVEHYQKYAFSLAFKILCNNEEAKDVVQETFIRIWKHIKTYNEQVKFTTWLYKIVTNLCLDILRSTTGKPQHQPIGNKTGLLPEQHTETIETEIINKEMVEAIKLFANSLPPVQRVVFTLRDLQGLDVNEIIQILAMDADKIKSNLYYARKTIREKMIKQGYTF